MEDSQVKQAKPLKWYYYKFLCDIGWKLRGSFGWKLYYDNLEKLAKCGFNIYGEPIKPNPAKGKI